jgi:membrane fusion protein (multidrug efflux system)
LPHISGLKYSRALIMAKTLVILDNPPVETVVMRVISGVLLLVLAACGEAREGGQEAPLVTPATVRTAEFVERLEAVGTARANEQVTLSAPVTQRIERINFEDGGYVAAGQVIAVLRQGEQAAQLADAQARGREAQQQLDRLQALRDRGFATRAAVDTQVALAASAQAQAAEARATIADRVVRAPFGGYASLRILSPGAVITAGTPIATISDIGRIKLDFPVPETALAAVREGQGIEARVAAYPDRRFRGTIDTIDPVVDPATRSVQVRAVLANTDRTLKPGMLMTVTIDLARRTSPAVPELAVAGSGAEKFVFLIGQDDVAQRTPVTTGLRRDGLIEVRSGVKPGQRVVGEGVVKVSDKMKLRTAPTPKPAAAGAR